MNEQTTSDILQIFIIFASSIFDSSVAAVIGPYLLIVFAAVTGAFWSLGRRESKDSWSSFFYFIRIVFTAVLLTSVLTEVTVRYVTITDANLLIAPIALLIGVVGDEWIDAFAWLLNILKKFANNIVNKKLGE